MSNGPRTGFDATLILMTGFFAVLGGLALCFGPMVSWKLRQIAEGFAYLGLFGGTFFMGGLILVALGTLRRGQDTLRRETWQQNSTDAHDVELDDDVQAIGMIVEQMAAEVSSVRTTFQASIDHGLQPLRDQIANLTNLASQQKPSKETDDAVFRMAASLDQLGARLGSQVGQRTSELEGRIETLAAIHDATIAAIKNLSNSVESARVEVTEAQRDTLARVEELANKQPAPETVAHDVDESSPTCPTTSDRDERPALNALTGAGTPSQGETADGAAATEEVAAALPSTNLEAPAFGLSSRTQAAHDAFIDGDGQTDDAAPALPGSLSLAGSLDDPAGEEAPSATQEGSLRDALERMRRECDPD